MNREEVPNFNIQNLKPHHGEPKYLSVSNQKQSQKLPATTHLIESCHLHGFPIPITFPVLFDVHFL